MAEKATYDGQADFVELIKSFSKFNRARFKKPSGSVNTYEVCIDNGSKYVTYGFIKDTNDDFIKLGKCFVGDMSAYQLSNQADASTQTGTFNTASPPFYYTTQVGATFTVTVLGTQIKLRSRKDPRGGME
ncbi:hypothetical protein ACN6MY_19665 [Peribacillus sp. B-H-3]|uniref:hypothetical protein n=1 Tax=Peribacillus sp. B-H-3 TaxID=3400420 RepID=UPI003B02BA24